jgi:hypothetical protein
LGFTCCRPIPPWTPQGSPRCPPVIATIAPGGVGRGQGAHTLNYRKQNAWHSHCSYTTTTAILSHYDTASALIYYLTCNALTVRHSQCSHILPHTQCSPITIQPVLSYTTSHAMLTLWDARVMEIDPRLPPLNCTAPTRESGSDRSGRTWGGATRREWRPTQISTF